MRIHLCPSGPWQGRKGSYAGIPVFVCLGLLYHSPKLIVNFFLTKTFVLWKEFQLEELNAEREKQIDFIVP